MPLAAAAANLAISPASPQMLDSVRLAVTESGTFVYDLDATQVSMTDGAITVVLRNGAALSPPPPARTNEFFLGQFPIGKYQVNVLLDQGTGKSPIGSTSFTVSPKSGARDTRPHADYTDLWWNAKESGWGVNVIQHPSGNLFVTLFTYDANGQPAWYVVPQGTWTYGAIFDGPVYRTTGPVVGANFDQSAVKRTLVGKATIYFGQTSSDTGNFVFDLGSGTFARILSRQPY